jgi:hydantoinase/carbamoylase family amidase
MNSELLEAVKGHLTEIGKIGFNGDGRGWTRLAFSIEEDRVHEYAESCMRNYGMQTHRDAFGNLYGRINKSNDAILMIGTHLDTVIHGGNYDGVVGFIVGIEAVHLAELQGSLRFPVELAVFRAEESTRFNKSCLGSQAAFGRLAAGEMNKLHYKTSSGAEKSLNEVLRERKLDVSEFGRQLVDPTNYFAYFETHIEQARVLDGLHALGVVTSIRAPERRMFAVRRIAGDDTGAHVVKAVARMVTAVEWTAELYDSVGHDIVATVGKVQGYFEGAIAVNTIPGSVAFQLLSLSHIDEEKITTIATRRQVKVRLVRSSNGVRIEVIGESDHSGGTPMGRFSRCDALVAACEMVLAIQDGQFPLVNELNFYLDLRSRSKETRNCVYNDITRTLELIANGFDVKLEVGDPTESGEPVNALDSDLQQWIRHVASAYGYKTVDLPSGAGHDAMIAAQAGIPTAMMFVPSRNGLSHNPNEFTEVEYICEAVEVQAGVLRSLSQKMA